MKCYEARGSGRELEALKRAASDNEDMKELVHYIGRLGAHKFHVLNIMAATSRLAFVKDIVDVFFVPSSQRRTLELPDEAFDFEKLSKRISRRLEASENIRKELYLLLMGKRYDNELQMENDLHAKPIIDTLVHCELTLFDHVMRNKLRFYKNDRYIGCSKPACYFCLHWLEAEGLVRPKSHYKVLLECRGPDFSSNVKWIEARNYLKLCQQVAQDLYKALLGPVPESRTRYQSTDGSRRALTSLSETSSML